MGLNQGGSSNRTYLSISDGKIAKRVEEGVPGAIKGTSKDGSRTWYETRFSSVSGKITDVFKRDSDKGYGSQLCIVLNDNGEEFQVQMPWSSRYSSGFFVCMPNIDPSKVISLSPWMKEIDGTKKTMLYLKQGGQDNVDWAWTRDNPGEMPEMKQIKVKGQVVWDDTDRQEFFEKYLNDTFLPKLKQADSVDKPSESKSEPEGSEDDLPF